MKTRQKIEQAIDEMWLKIGKITQRSIAEHLKIGERTVQRYIGKKELSEISKKRKNVRPIKKVACF